MKSLAAGALALLLAACSHANAPAEADHASTSAAGVAPETASTSTTANDDEPDSDDDKRHGLSTPPPGTLHYTIAVTGALHTTGKHKGEFRNTTIKRHIEVNAHMQATLTNGVLADVSPARPKGKTSTAEVANAPIEDLAREMAKCNGDMGCIMEKNAKRMANPEGEQAIRDAGRQMVGMIGRVAVFSHRAPCEGRMAIDDDDDRATWWEDVGEGYHNTGLDKSHSVIHADDKFDCTPKSPFGVGAVAADMITQGTLIYFDTQTGDYDITFGPSQISITPTVNGNPGKPVQAGTPEIALTGFSGAASGNPFSGNKSVDLKGDDGVPLHAEINWTFTPGKG